MCPCHGGACYQDGSAPLDLPSAACSSTATKLKMENFSLKAGEMPTPGQPVAHKAGGKPTCALIQKVGDWFDLRLQLGTPIRETAQHMVPHVRPQSWFYVFSGSAGLTCFMLQVVTGILLALIYVPSAGEAWNSLQTLNHVVSLGWFIRALHGWGSNFMVAIVPDPYAAGLPLWSLQVSKKNLHGLWACGFSC